MKLYAGIDLHSTNCYIGVVDEKGKKVAKGRPRNEMEDIMSILSPRAEDLAGIAVESTYNWYWLVDALMEAGYCVHLANPAAIQQYKGLKHVGDRHDAFWLADMLRLNILPEGYIYPKKDRPTRDLLRTRSMLVRKRSELIASLSNIIARNTGKRLRSTDIKAVKENRVHPLLDYHEDLSLSADVLKETIDFLGRKIKRVEGKVLEQEKVRPGYENLKTIPGVGIILALTILLETGPIERFLSVGNYASYCRKVSSRYISNEKTKGRGNIKNGNRYLAWAFGEAAEHARRHNNQARTYYNRKMSKANAALAHAALAHKLARAAYHIMKSKVAFMPERVFV